MKTTFCVLIFLCFFSNAYSQDYDLIVTTNGDSIACNIDSITDATVYFEMKHNNNWIHTNINRDEVIEYQYGLIDKKFVVFKPGTSYIDKLYAETDTELIRALKLQKTGRTLNIVGGASLGVVVVSGILGGPVGVDTWALIIIGGGAMIIGGTSFAIGIPMNIIGKKRVAQINSIKNTAYNGITLDLKPCAQYDLITQTYQPAVMLRISF